MDGAGRPDRDRPPAPTGRRPAPARLSDRVRRFAGEEKSHYADGAQRPLGGYLGAIGLYAAGVIGLGAVAVRRGVRPPEAVSPWDVVLLGVATHKASRLISKDSVTSVLRAPFTRFRGAQGEAELAEEVRGKGARHAVGELVTCPFCLDQWIATGFAFGLLFAPPTTRLVAGAVSAQALADFLHLAYAGAQQALE